MGGKFFISKIKHGGSGCVCVCVCVCVCINVGVHEHLRVGGGGITTRLACHTLHNETLSQKNQCVCAGDCVLVCCVYVRLFVCVCVYAFVEYCALLSIFKIY